MGALGAEVEREVFGTGGWADLLWGGAGMEVSLPQSACSADSPAGPAPLLSALRTFSPLTGKSALVRGGLGRCRARGRLWVRRKVAGGIPERRGGMVSCRKRREGVCRETAFE